MTREYGPSPLWKQLPDGSLLYDFDGHVHAEGLDFTITPRSASLNPPPDPEAISWDTDESPSQPVAQAYGEAIRQVGPVRSTNLAILQARDNHAQGDTSITPTAVLRATRDNSSPATAEFDTVANGLGNTDLTAATARAGANVVKVITGGNNSDFLRLLGPQLMQAAFGRVTMHWSNVNEYSDAFSVAHGLGRVPQLVLITGTFIAFTPAGFATWVVRSVDNLQFLIYGRTSNGVNPGIQNIDVYWLAIG